MKRYAIINDQNVINVIEYETAPSNPPPGFESPIIAVQSDVAGPGWEYINGHFVAPVVPVPEPTIEEIKARAVGLLTASDWSEIPSVIDDANTPHLLNQSDFVTYRIALRRIAVNPTLDAQFPTEPSALWSEE